MSFNRLIEVKATDNNKQQQVISDFINIARALTSVRLCEECKENLRQLLKVSKE